MTPETQAFGQQMGLVAPKPTVVAQLLPTSKPVPGVQPAPVQPAPQVQAPAPMQPVSLPHPAANGLDPKIVTLAQAIRQVESGGDFTRPGASGEYGAYQFMPGTWAATAPKYGVNVPLKQATPQQQNEVAYKQLAEWSAQHPDWNVGNFASAWNAGPGKPNAYLEGNAGTNSQGVRYDTAAYAKKVAEAYQQYKAQNIAISPPPSPQGGFSPDAPSGSPSFLGNLGADFNNRAQQLAQTDAKYASGQQGALSTILQDAGHVAGGFNDVFGEALGAADRILTGGRISGALSTGAHALANTAPGQALAKAASDFSTAHPEATANIGALANIAALFPAGKVGSLGIHTAEAGAEKLAGTEAAQALGNHAVEDVKKNLTDIFTHTKPLEKAYDHVVSRGFDPERVLAERKLIPDIVDGKVHVPEDSNILNSLNNEIATKSQLLDNALSKYRQTISAADLKTFAQDEIAKNPEFRQQGRVPEMQAKAAKIIDSYVTQEGKTRFKLIDVQGMKRGQASLSSKYRKNLDFGNADDHSAVASALRGAIENKTPDLHVRKLNRQIGELEETTNLLTKANGSAVRGGRLGRYGARILGATIGSQGHIPIVSPILGAFMGDAIVSGLQKAKIAGPINRLLMKVAQVAPDNAVVKETQAFVEAVESGEKVMPSDDVAEFLAKLSAKSDIPLLPPAAHDALRSVVNNDAKIPLPEKTLSTLDAEHAANPNIKNPQRLDGLSSTAETKMTANAMDNNANIPDATTHMANGDALSTPAKISETGGGTSPTTASKPSTDTATRTGNAPIGRGDVSAQKADTSAGFEGHTYYHGTNASIGGEGLKPSSIGVLGNGIYLTPDIKTAGQYGKNVLETKLSNAKLLPLNSKEAEAIARDAGTYIFPVEKKFEDALLKAGYDGLIDSKGNISIKSEALSKAVNSNLTKSSPSIPKELAPLAAEAKKYKTAEEFVKVYTDKFHDLQQRAASLFNQVKKDKAGHVIPNDALDKQFDALKKELKAQPDLTKLTDIFNRVKGTK